MSTPTRWQRIVALGRLIRAAATRKGNAAKAARAQTVINDAKAIPDPKPTPPPVLHYPGIIAARFQSQNGPQHGEGECLLAVQECYGIPARDPSAAAAWTLAAHKHRTTDPNAIPRGYPIFWTGGSHGFGHVAIADGNGRCWSTDIKRIGFFDLVPIDQIRAQWGLVLVGWAEDLEGVTVVASR